MSGLIREENGLETIEEMNDWVSPHLKIRFEIADPELKIYHPNGEVFTNYTEEKQWAEQERQRAEKLANKLRELNTNPNDL